MQIYVNIEKAKTQDFTWKPNLKKPRGGGREFNIFKRLELSRANTLFTISDFDATFA